METFPQVPNNYFTERKGVIKVCEVLNEFGLIFRETPNADVGIDGQIEYVNNEGQAIGRILAAQIKSGDSYLHDKVDHWAFYADKKHKSYWEVYPIPVILLVYSPKFDCIYFTDVRYQLNVPQANCNYIKISKQSILSISGKNGLFESTGNLNDEPFYEIAQLFNVMISGKNPNPTFYVSYLDLFLLGLTNICRQVFFSMSLACEIAEYNNETEFGMSVGPSEHDFLHDYVKFLVSQNIAKVDYGDYLIDWREREIQSKFIATITQRGQKLLEYIKIKESESNDNLPPGNLVIERLLSMNYMPSDSLRFEKVKKFYKLLSSK